MIGDKESKYSIKNRWFGVDIERILIGEVLTNKQVNGL